ncbi:MULTISPECIES: mandelate racemase/muconate lactonizing enzyme family protein [Maribacter]|uniref:Dipeptide epimerase n=1 Tax=Maribacter flavus TaxID=1658664 RepID=A0ABU7IHM6_9FLAO|nr:MULTISPECIES: dipeptide epimerase [Maribacter]MDC6404960.1 dipeptide epimerase [Maribacter sp. PR66]MEE1972374.1 dipeptide epimerase [Maribacter flavus]
MKITKVSYERLDLELAVSYTIAYQRIDATTNFILKLETDGNWVGYGCSVPDMEVTHETPEDVQNALDSIIIPYLKNKDPFTFALILSELRTLLGKKSSCLAMVDLALYDLLSKKAQVPLFKFLGGYRSSIPTSITIGILNMGETVRQAYEYTAMGFSILKIKGGLNLEEDIAKMIRLHEAFPHVKFRFDGNQGYTVQESIAFVRATSTIGIEIFEQPTKQESDEHLGEVTGQVDIPVMADESLKTLTDAFRLAQNERVDMVNIKLQKVGGILTANHISSVAKAAKLETMVGCIDECGLGISAGLHFALSRPNIVYADLDGHLDLVGDPFKNIFRLEKGVLYPTERYGLGYSE